MRSTTLLSPVAAILLLVACAAATTRTPGAGDREVGGTRQIADIERGTFAVSRNWAWQEFQAPGLIYEVGDSTDRDLIRQVAATAARGTMEILLQEWREMEAQGGS